MFKKKNQSIDESIQSTTLKCSLFVNDSTKKTEINLTAWTIHYFSVFSHPNFVSTECKIMFRKSFEWNCSEIFYMGEMKNLLPVECVRMTENETYTHTPTHTHVHLYIHSCAIYILLWQFFLSASKSICFAKLFRYCVRILH